MKKLLLFLTVVLSLSFAANAKHAIPSKEKHKVQIASGKVKVQGKFIPICTEVTLSCTCGNLCGNFNSVVEWAMAIAWWEGYLCGYNGPGGGCSEVGC